LVFFAIPVATLDGVDRGSEVEVVTGEHVYPADPIGVQSVIHGTNFNVTGSVLNCDKLTFFTYPLKYGLLFFQ
jgi:hypothetical protein